VRFAVAQVDASLEHITDDAPAYDGSAPTTRRAENSEARRTVGRLHGELAYQRFEDVVEAGIHHYLLHVQRECYRVGECIEDEFFAHRPLTAAEVLG
jgi:uncharacterized alpha-E superfamily protein